MYLLSPNLHGVRHGFFGRSGGVSGGIYASLNCGWGSGDERNNIVENRTRVAKALGTREPNLLSLYQIHGNRVITVDTPWTPDTKPQADAMVTRKRGIALGILTADCVPVLFADTHAGIIGAAHAGWKGTLAGVLEQTIIAMLALGAKRESIHAAIGPCIAQSSYEVGRELRETFLQGDARREGFFKPAPRKGHWQFDIRGCVRGMLAQSGIQSINALENDTYMEENDFFSFRRNTHRGEADYGRQISAIVLT